MRELMFVKVLMLIRSAHPKSKIRSSVCNDCHNVLMIFIDVNSIVILNIPGVDYSCIIVGITKSETITLLRNNADLIEKSGQL